MMKKCTLSVSLAMFATLFSACAMDASTYDEQTADQALVSENPMSADVPDEEPEGFGCPDDSKCHRHCKSIRGRRGGYCTGFLDLRCVCYRR